MQLERTFSVTAPIGTVWETLMDFERVAGCIPGAQILEKTSEDEYQVAMKVKLGPVTMQYKGTLYVVERDAAGRRATLQGKARETRGQGAAEATVTMQLSASGAATEGSVNADLTLSGKAAAMGKSVIGSVTDQMLAVFTKNPAGDDQGAGVQGAAGRDRGRCRTRPLHTPRRPRPRRSRPHRRRPLDDYIRHICARRCAAAGAARVRDRDQPAAPPSSSAGAQPGSAAETEPAAPPSSSSPAPSAPAARQGDTSLDGLALARQVLADQLRSPGKVLGLVVVAAALAHLAGRRSGRRQAVALLRSGRRVTVRDWYWQSCCPAGRQEKRRAWPRWSGPSSPRHVRRARRWRSPPAARPSARCRGAVWKARCTSWPPR